MASDRVGSASAANVAGKVNSSSGPDPEDLPDRSLQKRQARVTVKYNRKELQRRLDVEKWIDECMDKLYLGKVSCVDQQCQYVSLLVSIRVCIIYVITS